MNILFALNQNTEKITEEMILNSYKEFAGKEFTYSKEYDLSGVKTRLKLEKFDILILNEELERDNLITTTYIDEITDKHTDCRIILVVMSSHEKDSYIRRLFNIGAYDLIYSHDINIETLVNLIATPRTKVEAKLYLDLHDVDDAKVESELKYIPDEQLGNILAFFDKTLTEDLPEVFERVYHQYNEYQRIYLFNNLTEEMKSALKGNELFEELSSKVGFVFVENEETGEGTSSSEVKSKEVKDRKPFIPPITINVARQEVVTETKDVGRGKMLGSVYIAIGNSIRGAGSSFVSLSVGSYFTSLGFSVAVIEVNPNPSYSNLSKDKDKAYITKNGIDIYYVNKNNRNNDYSIPNLEKSYEYIISDLGVLKSSENGTFVNNPNYQEFIRSAVKVLMISGCEWKWGEVYPFLVNENMENWNLFISPSSKKVSSIIIKELSSYNKRIVALPYCESPFELNEEITNTYNNAFKDYINLKKTKKTKLKFPKISFGKN